MSNENSTLDIPEVIKRTLWEDLHPLVGRIEDGTIRLAELFPILRRMGAFGFLIPQEYGGQGLQFQAYCSIIEEFSKIHGGLRVLVHVHNSMAHAFSIMANERQKQDVLPGAAQGHKSVAFALTEPDYGSGADIGTTAVRDDGCFILNGRKHLITNADFASHFIVFAKTIPGSRASDSVTAFCVERSIEGFTMEPMPETMGCKGGTHALLRFDNVRLPKSAVLGIEGRGLGQMEEALEISRLFIAASSLGSAERALELSVRFAKNRVTFGKPISERQAVQRYLAEMATDIYALRQMIEHAARALDAGKRISGEGAMCKLFGLEAVGRVTDRALLVHGGVGYTQLHEIERLYRDARLNWLEEGTPTIQYAVIAKTLKQDA